MISKIIKKDSPISPHAALGGSDKYGSALKSIPTQGQSSMATNYSPHKRKNSSSNVVLGTSPPPSLFTGSAHPVMRGSLGILIFQIMLGQSPGIISKNKVQRIVPYPNCLVLPFQIEVNYFFKFVNKVVHQSYNVVKKYFAKLIVDCEA